MINGPGVGFKYEANSKTCIDIQKYSEDYADQKKVINSRRGSVEKNKNEQNPKKNKSKRNVCETKNLKSSQDFTNTITNSILNTGSPARTPTKPKRNVIKTKESTTKRLKTQTTLTTKSKESPKQTPAPIKKNKTDKKPENKTLKASKTITEKSSTVATTKRFTKTIPNKNDKCEFKNKLSIKVSKFEENSNSEKTPEIQTHYNKEVCPSGQNNSLTANFDNKGTSSPDEIFLNKTTKEKNIKNKYDESNTYKLKVSYSRKNTGGSSNSPLKDRSHLSPNSAKKRNNLSPPRRTRNSSSQLGLAGNTNSYKTISQISKNSEMEDYEEQFIPNYKFEENPRTYKNLKEVLIDDITYDGVYECIDGESPTSPRKVGAPILIDLPDLKQWQTWGEGWSNKSNEFATKSNRVSWVGFQQNQDNEYELEVEN